MIIKLGMMDIQVELADHLTSPEGEALLGLWIPLESKIKIQKGLSPDMFMLTLWHEVLHAFYDSRGLDSSSKKMEERLDVLAYGITELLVRNPQLAKKIVLE